MLRNLPTYERLVGVWELPGPEATATIGWLLEKVVSMVGDDDPPLPIA